MKPALFLFTLFFLSACGHHRDVRPGNKGINTVSVLAEDETSGMRDALNQANHFCDESEKKAIVLEESSKYTGDMDESTYKNMKKASKVGKTLSGTKLGTNSGTSPVGSKRNQTGSATGVGSEVLDDLAGQGYTVTMRFRCE